MANAPTQFQPGDQVALLDGSSPMTVISVKEDGQLVTCESSSEDNPAPHDYEAIKLTKLHSGEQTGSKA